MVCIYISSYTLLYQLIFIFFNILSGDESVLSWLQVYSQISTVSNCLSRFFSSFASKNVVPQINSDDNYSFNLKTVKFISIFLTIASFMVSHDFNNYTNTWFVKLKQRFSNILAFCWCGRSSWASFIFGTFSSLLNRLIQSENWMRDEFSVTYTFSNRFSTGYMIEN